jgi:allantoinase
MSKLAIHSVQTLLPAQVADATVLVEDGLIVKIEPGAVSPEDFTYSDVGNKVLMAGVIDPHVHINEPGRTHWEGFDTATKAAISGGVTSLVEMPLNASPVTCTAEAFEKKLAAAENKLHTNVGFWGGVIPGNTDELEPLIEMGVLGFKAFLTHSGIDEFPNANEADLRKAMPIIAKHGLPLLVHCELADDLQPATQDPRSYWQYMQTRPKEWEDKAIAMMIRLCEEFNCRVHIVHLSSANSIEQIKNAKAKGLPLTVETAQHYLYFNAEEIPDGNTAFKCAPPIREKANNELLWQALKDGIIDFVATDHSPAPPETKQVDTGDFTTAWGGIASIQFALPALWTAAKKHNCSLENMAEWLSARPATLAGLQSKRGSIEVGKLADLLVWDAEKSFTLTEEMILHRHKLTPYLHQTLTGQVEQVYLAGEKVFDNGTIAALNKGHVLKPEGYDA